MSFVRIRLRAEFEPAATEQKQQQYTNILQDKHSIFTQKIIFIFVECLGGPVTFQVEEGSSAHGDKEKREAQ